ncbi:Hypothetical predicted protein, partial [Paramuricea clavata]
TVFKFRGLPWNKHREVGDKINMGFNAMVENPGTKLPQVLTRELECIGCK